MTLSRWPGYLIAIADSVALVALRPDLPRLTEHAASPRSWLAEAGADQVVATLAAAALWAAAVWVGLGLLAGLAARLPGGLGRGAQRVAAAVLPLVLRRVLAGTAGLGVLLAPVAAGAIAPSAFGGAPPPSSTLPSMPPPTLPSTLPGPAWPSAPPTSTPSPLPAPVWPHSASTPDRSKTVGTPAPSASRPAPSQHKQPPDRRTAEPPQTTEPGHPSAPRDRPPAPPARSADEVRVGRGDSLWKLSAHRLGPDATAAEITAYWPEVYAANRKVIGADPGLITPGQVLHVPPPIPQEEQ